MQSVSRTQLLAAARLGLIEKSNQGVLQSLRQAYADIKGESLYSDEELVKLNTPKCPNLNTLD
jgi:hypothetical protein